MSNDRLWPFRHFLILIEFILILFEIRFIFQALQQAKIKLEVLYSIIELTMLETPKITRLIPFEDFHVDSLKTRLQASGL